MAAFLLLVLALLIATLFVCIGVVMAQHYAEVRAELDQQQDAIAVELQALRLAHQINDVHYWATNEMRHAATGSEWR